MALAIKNFETLGYVTLVTPPSMMNPEKVSFAILDLEEEQKNQFAIQLNTIFPNDNVTVFVYNSGAPVGWIREATLKAKYVLANMDTLPVYIKEMISEDKKIYNVNAEQNIEQAFEKIKQEHVEV